MSQLLEGDWLTTGVLRVCDTLSAEELATTGIIPNAWAVLRALADLDGAPLTAQGRLATGFLVSMIRRLWWGTRVERALRAGPRSNREHMSVRPVELLRRGLEAAGIVDQVGGRLVLTRTGRDFLEPAHAGQLYARLFKAYFVTLEHSAIDGEPNIETAWRYVPYALLVIGSTTDWTPASRLVSMLLPPDVFDRCNRLLRDGRGLPPPGRHGSPSVEDLLLLRLLGPLQDFAVIEGRVNSGEFLPSFRRGHLYDRALRFDFKTPGYG